eukprot:6365341-Prymnesium_polylepis.3
MAEPNRGTDYNTVVHFHPWYDHVYLFQVPGTDGGHALTTASTHARFSPIKRERCVQPRAHSSVVKILPLALAYCVNESHGNLGNRSVAEDVANGHS